MAVGRDRDRDLSRARGGDRRRRSRAPSEREAVYGLVISGALRASAIASTRDVTEIYIVKGSPTILDI